MADSHGLQSPEAISEKYTLTREKSSIGFEIGNNVTVQLSATSEVDSGRGRDSSNVHTKVIMDHKGDIQYLRGRILTSNGPLIGFRSIHESVGESLNLINLQTKDRHRFKVQDLPHRIVDMAFAQHHKFFAVLAADSTFSVFEISDNCEKKKYLTISNWPDFDSRASDEQPHLSWCPYIQGDDDDDEQMHMVAVYLGRQVYIVNVGILKDAELGDAIEFEDAKSEEGGIFSHYFNDQPDNPNLHITAVCISPDSTAVAIAKSEGPIQFFTFNEERNTLTDAHCFEPRGFGKSGPIDDLIFLDDLSPDRKGLQFWRSCVVVSNDGHKVAIYECQSWRCLGRIRFEATRAVNKFIAIPDPLASFIHLLDVDGMNLYSIEIRNPFRIDEHPRFVGITQTSFCNPIFAIHPITVNTFESSEDSGDDLFENGSNDDETESESEESCSDSKMKWTKSKRQFVAMGKRSMVELQLTLKQHIPSPIGTIVDSSEKEPSPSINVDTQQTPPTSAGPPPPGLLMQLTPQPTSSINVEMVNQKLDLVLAKLGQIEEERKDTNEKMVQQIVASLDENMRVREGYMLNRIEQLCENGRLDTIAAVRNGLLNLGGQLENSVRTNGLETAEYISQRVGSATRSALTECLLPAFERSCEVLFERLNEHFKQGINEYLASSSQMIQGTAVAAMQMTVQQQQQKNEMDRLALLQLIETNPEAAIEGALNKRDPNLVEWVCSKINPEKVLIPGNTKLDQNVLLSLVSQLTPTLAKDRDLKFKWIELVIPEIDVHDPETKMIIPPIAQNLVMALQDLVEGTTDEQTRRYIRLLYQMIRSSLLQSNTPSQRNIAAASSLHKYRSDN